MNRFIFHSVGQGMFYTGNIGNYQFVYDCGATTILSRKKKIVKSDEPYLLNSIDKYYDSTDRKVIDFLVISHLDADHVNGIPYLRSKFHVNKVLLPYFPAMLYNSLVFKAYLYLQGISDEMVSFLIGAYAQSSELESLEEDSKFDFDDRINYYLVKGKRDVVTKKWEFIFFNSPYNVSIAMIQSLEKNIDSLLKKYSFSDLTEAVQSDLFIQELNKLYKGVFGKHKLNQTSIIMLHYPSQKHMYNYDCPFICLGDCLKNNYGTLLTGDIDFRQTASLVMDINSEIINMRMPLSICSLPHHGSHKNFQSFVANIRIGQSKFIMSYGIINPWPKSFPNYKTISDISKMGNHLIYVNEFQDFTYYV